jgi:hypothetical protein
VRNQRRRKKARAASTAQPTTSRATQTPTNRQIANSGASVGELAADEPCEEQAKRSLVTNDALKNNGWRRRRDSSCLRQPQRCIQTAEVLNGARARAGGADQLAAGF